MLHASRRRADGVILSYFYHHGAGHARRHAMRACNGCRCRFSTTMAADDLLMTRAGTIILVRRQDWLPSWRDYIISTLALMIGARGQY